MRKCLQKYDRFILLGDLQQPYRNLNKFSCQAEELVVTFSETCQ